MFVSFIRRYAIICFWDLSFFYTFSHQMWVGMNEITKLFNRKDNVFETWDFEFFFFGILTDKKHMIDVFLLTVTKTTSGGLNENTSKSYLPINKEVGWISHIYWRTKTLNNNWQIPDWYYLQNIIKVYIYKKSLSCYRTSSFGRLNSLNLTCISCLQIELYWFIKSKKLYYNDLLFSTI